MTVRTKSLHQNQMVKVRLLSQRQRPKAQKNYERVLREYYDAKYDAPKIWEELYRRAALASERVAQGSTS